MRNTYITDAEGVRHKVIKEIDVVDEDGSEYVGYLVDGHEILFGVMVKSVETIDEQ